MSLDEVKLRALAARQRTERIAGALWAGATGLTPAAVYHTQIPERLLLGVAFVDDNDRHQAYVLARAAGYVYRESSDVLHGRLRSAHVGVVQLEEWEAAVAALEALLQSHPLLAP